jgi:predicted ester cyclase
MMIMNKIDIVKTAFSFDTPPEVSRGYLADDFQWSDSNGSPPMNKAAWMGMGELMEASFPDVGNVIEEIRQDGEEVVVVSHFTGTFENDFDLSALNMGVIPATGKAVKFPSATTRISFDGDKISGIKDLDSGPNAGMAGFLAALK